MNLQTEFSSCFTSNDLPLDIWTILTLFPSPIAIKRPSSIVGLISNMSWDIKISFLFCFFSG